MAVDLSERLDLAPELRVACSAYREEFGRSPAVAWQVPGMVTLLADGPLRLTVAAPWGAIAVAGPPHDVIELTRMEEPGQKVRLTVAAAAAGGGPSWAGTGLLAARAGATLLTRTELPEGTGLGAAAATETAIGLCLADAAAPGLPGAAGPQADAGPQAMMGGRRLRFDVRAAGLRLVIIDTGLRGAPRREPAEHAPVLAAAEAIDAGRLSALGPALTAVHESLPSDPLRQVAVSAALRSGALGARMITDGPGRPVLALVPAGRLAGLRATVSAEFARQGLRAPRFLSFTPAGGPSRVRT